MRRCYLSIALASLVAMIAAAQPQITWLERQHDFGVFMEQDGKVTCQMPLVNTGDAPLMIVKAQAGCGCTGIDYPEAPIPPGDTAMVSITYNPAGRPGQFTKQVLIFTNTTPRRTVLEITGNVIPTAATLDKQYPLQAGSLRISQREVPMGELPKGKNKTQYLSAYNASTDTMVVSVTGAKSHLSPAIVPDTVPPARVTALTVHYHSANAPLWGLNTDTLTLVCEPLGPESSVIPGTAQIHVMAQVMEDFGSLTDQQRRDAPVAAIGCGDRIDFGTVKAGDVVSKSFEVTNRGKEYLLIRRLWVPEGEGVTCTTSKTDIKRGKSATVTVTVDTSKQQGEMLNVPLTLITNDPESPRITVRLVGIIDKI